MLLGAVALVVSTLLLPSVSGPADPPAVCDLVDGVEQLVGAGGVVLVGELHGTREAPGFVTAMACHALEAGLSVVVGLEVPAAEQQRIDAFVSSAGSAADVDELLAGGFWTATPHDGRSSAAMLDMLNWARRSRADGADIAVVLIDEVGAPDRDAVMGARVVAIAEDNPTGLTVVLTGNVHAATEPPDGAGPDFQPMGFRVVDALGAARVTSVDIAFAGGTAWVTLDGETAGEQQFGERVDEPGDITPAVTLSDAAPPGFDGVYDVGYIHASPPAVHG